MNNKDAKHLYYDSDIYLDITSVPLANYTTVSHHRNFNPRPGTFFMN